MRARPVAAAGTDEAAVAALLANVRSALFITGSGLSADSQLAHYRGIPGLRRRVPEDGPRFEATLSAEMLSRAPLTTWQLLRDMDVQIRDAEPNAGHRALVRFEQHLERCTVMTVNIDRLHQRAGSKTVIEMHGAFHDLACTRCELSTRHVRYDHLALPPRCGVCETVLRPDMPLFGEQLPADPFTRLQAELDEGFDVVVVVGVAVMFPYLARPVLVAKADSVPTVEIGVTATDISGLVDVRLSGSPARVLASIEARYCELRQRASFA